MLDQEVYGFGTVMNATSYPVDLNLTLGRPLITITTQMAECYWSKESSHLRDTHTVMGTERRALGLKPTFSIFKQL